MFRLFQSIFSKGAPEHGRSPEQLIQKAIERAVDATDPRLRALPGYERQLRQAVICAIDHVVALVEQLSPPAKLSRERYGTDPQLSAFFASPEHLQQILSTDPALCDFLAGLEGAASERIIALLTMERRERQVLGMDLQADVVRREVPQVTVSFANHRFLDPTSTEEETRRRLKRRAFDHLLSLALGRIAAARLHRAGLEQQRSLLRRKLKALQSGHWSFEESRHGDGSNAAELEAELEKIETQMLQRGTDVGTLKAHLDTLVDTLSRAKSGLWSTPLSLTMDRLGVKREPHAAGTLQLELEELHNVKGRAAIVRLLSIPHDALPPRRDFLREAKRYLG